jgi:hypothetical protein
MCGTDLENIWAMFSMRDWLEEHVTSSVLVRMSLLDKLHERYVSLDESAREDNDQASPLNFQRLFS